MNCEYKEKTILYFYGELPEGASAELKAHIGSCSSCAGDLRALKSLSEGFDAFKPRVPALNAEELVIAARGAPLMERLLAGFRRAAVAGAFTALFLLTFQAAGFRSEPVAWKTDIDAGLDKVEYGIYSLQDDMSYSSAADFDYGCADIEDQKEHVAKKTA